MSTKTIVDFPEDTSRTSLIANAGKLPVNSHLTDVSRYIRFLKRRGWPILLFALIGALIGLVRAAHYVPVYDANLTLLIEPNRGKSSFDQYLFSYANPYFFYKTQYQIVRSRAVAEIVVDKMGVSRQPLSRSESESRTNSVYSGIRRWFGEKQSQGNTTSRLVDRDSMVDRIRNNIRVRGGEQSQIVYINFRSTDPQFAADAANATAQAYTALSLQTRRSSALVASDWLNNQIEDLRQKVAESEARLQAYQSKESLVDSERDNELTTGRLSQLNERYLLAQSSVSNLEKRYGARHPTLLAAKSEAGELRRRLEKERGTVVATQGKTFELAKLERDVATYRQLYEQVLTRFKEADIAAQNDINDVRVIDAARPPLFPVGPSRNRSIFLLALLGLILGSALCWLREQLDNTFKTPEDVESRLSLPVLGLVPMVKNTTGDGLIIPERRYLERTKSGFSETINHIRTNMLFSNVDKPPQVVLITSALQGEGKTTLAVNLALAFSKLGRTVLVDADLRRPRIAEFVNGNPNAGLVEVIANRCTLEDALVKDAGSAQLSVLPTGITPPNPLELISSSRFSKLMSVLRTKFDYVVIDSAPVVPVSDAMVLTQFVDVVSLVIRTDHTSHAVAQSAFNRLAGTHCNNIGVVLTQVKQRHLMSYYHDGYYNYYQAYKKDQKKTREVKRAV